MPCPSSSSSAPRAALRLARTLLRRAPQQQQQPQAQRRLLVTWATAATQRLPLPAPTSSAGLKGGAGVQRSQLFPAAAVHQVPRRRLSAAAAVASAQKVGRLVKVLTNSKLANRDDVKTALAAALEGQGMGAGAEEVKQMDQALFRGFLPSNMWVVELGSREAAQRLLRQRQVQSPSGNLRVEEISEAELKRMHLASARGLDACSVHVQNVPANMGVDEVAYFFRDFRLNPDGIRPLPTEGERLAQEHLEQGGQDDQQRNKPKLTYHQQQYQRQYRSFVVKFDSPDEAQRAIREKQAEQWGQGKVHIVSYK